MGHGKPRAGPPHPRPLSPLPTLLGGDRQGSWASAARASGPVGPLARWGQWGWGAGADRPAGIALLALVTSFVFPLHFGSVCTTGPLSRGTPGVDVAHVGCCLQVASFIEPCGGFWASWGGGGVVELAESQENAKSLSLGPFSSQTKGPRPERGEACPWRQAPPWAAASGPVDRFPFAL